MPIALISDRTAPNPQLAAELSGAHLPPVSGTLYSFSTRSTAMEFPLRGMGFFLQRQPRDFYRRIIVAPEIRLYRSTMTKDWLANLYNALLPGGELLLCRRAAGVALLTDEELTSLFPSEVCEGVVIARRGEPLPLTEASVLPALWRRFGDLILNEMGAGSISVAEPGKAQEYFREMLTSEPFEHRRSRTGEPESEWTLDISTPRYRNAVESWVRYRMSGVYYKAPIIAHILGQELSRPNLSVYEHGGGVGLVPMQLLHEPNIGSMVNREINSGYLVPGRVLFDELRDRIGGRYRVSVGPSEAATYSQRYDAVSFVHVLLCLERKQVAQTLQRALDAAGLVLILENTSPPNTHAAGMFSPDELDTILSSLGTVTYYDEKTGDRSDRDTTRRQVRVLKPAAPLA